MLHDWRMDAHVHILVSMVTGGITYNGYVHAHDDIRLK